VTSTSSTLTLALVAEPAPVLARTKQSLRTDRKNETALKERKPASSPQEGDNWQAFLIFCQIFESLAKYLLSLPRSLKAKLQQITYY